MSTNQAHNLSASTPAWVTFTYIQFAFALGMSAVGIWVLPDDLMTKGYMAMAVVFAVGAAFTLAKTVRDEHEARRMANRLEEARAEKLLMEVGRSG